MGQTWKHHKDDDDEDGGRVQELFNATRGCALKSHVTPPKPRWLKGFHTKITVSLRPLFKECAIADTSPSLPTLKSSDFIQFMFNLLSLNSGFFVCFMFPIVFSIFGGGAAAPTITAAITSDPRT